MLDGLHVREMLSSALVSWLSVEVAITPGRNFVVPPMFFVDLVFFVEHVDKVFDATPSMGDVGSLTNEVDEAFLVCFGSIFSGKNNVVVE